MTFHSILFERAEDSIKEETLEAPAFFVDLNLDQIVDAITAGKQDYNLKPFFYTPLHDIYAIQYRHEVMRDPRRSRPLRAHCSFAQDNACHARAPDPGGQALLQISEGSWFLDAVEIYCDAVIDLVHDLSLVELQSRGFLAFRDYLSNYAQSDRFTTLQWETKQLLADLSAVNYCFSQGQRHQSSQIRMRSGLQRRSRSHVRKIQAGSGERLSGRISRRAGHEPRGSTDTGLRRPAVPGYFLAARRILREQPQLSG